MTAEQYQQVISIDNRINQLEKVQEEIKETKTHYLTYCKKETGSSFGYSICADYGMVKRECPSLIGVG